jgi:hypothetical protein
VGTIVPMNSTLSAACGGPQCAKRTSHIGQLTRGGLGKPLGRGEVAPRLFQLFKERAKKILCVVMRRYASKGDVTRRILPLRLLCLLLLNFPFACFEYFAVTSSALQTPHFAPSPNWVQAPPALSRFLPKKIGPGTRRDKTRQPGSKRVKPGKSCRDKAGQAGTNVPKGSIFIMDAGLMAVRWRPAGRKHPSIAFRN